MIIDLPDGSEVEVPDDAPPEVRERVKQKIRLKFSGGEEPSALGRAGGYLAKRAGEFGSAAVRLGKDAIRFPATERPGMESVSDLATVGGPALALTAGPVLGPATVVGGLAAGAGAAAAGMPNPELAEAAVNVGGGALGVGKAVLRGGKALLKGAPIAEGDALRAMAPATHQTIAKTTAAKFDPIVAFLEKSGRTIRGNTPEGADLIQAFQDALELPQVVGAEKRIVTGLLDTISKYGELTPQQMNDGMHALNVIKKGATAKGAMNKAMGILGQGTPVEGKLAEAQREYHRLIIPAKELAGAMGKKTPGEAAAAVVRKWNAMNDESRAIADPDGVVAALIPKIMERAPQMQSGGLAAVHAVQRAGAYFMQGNVFHGMLSLAGAAPKAVARAAGRAVPGAVRGVAGAAGALQGTSSGVTESPLARPPSPEEEPPTAAPSGPQGALPQPPGRQAASGVKPLPGPYGREIAAVSHVVGIDPSFMQSIMKREGAHGDPTVVSADPPGPGRGDAVGLMQLLPGTFETLRPKVEALLGRKASITNPLDNLTAGALYLKQGLEASGGDIEGAARYYHGGPNLAMHGPRTQAYGQAIVEASLARARAARVPR